MDWGRSHGYDRLVVDDSRLLDGGLLDGGLLDRLVAPSGPPADVVPPGG